MEIAKELFEKCRQGKALPAPLLERLIQQATSANPRVAAPASQALFRDLVEPLSDAFEPEFCDLYADLFSRVIHAVEPRLEPAEMVARYRRLRRPRRFEGAAGEIQNVFVLSRVTLGADVAITSTILDAAKRRFPKAKIYFVGGKKGWELFAGDPRLRHLAVPYSRGSTLRDKLAVWPELKKATARAHSIVIDPDSRLSQLGLLPLGQESKYFFFESRSYGGDGEESLAALTRRWVAETFEVNDAAPYIATEEQVDFGGRRIVAVSLGVGENPAKRIADPFEEELLRHLADSGDPLLIDKGAGGEEGARVERAVHRSGADPGQIRVLEGSFASFAARIAGCRLYVGYDSSGQHVAAACGVPLVTVFAGFPSPRMLARWRPCGSGPIEVVRVDDPTAPSLLERTLAAVRRVQEARLGLTES